MELALAGAQSFRIVNRGAERGQELVDLLLSKTPAKAEYQAWKGPYRVPLDADIVINATSIGLFPDVDATLDLDINTLRPELVVADGIHNPPLTHLLRAARERGCRTVDGLGMLVNQGVIGVEYWTGLTPDSQVMRESLLALKL